MAKILVIDDEEQMRNVLTKMLTHDGHEVFVAQDGVEGVKRFYLFKPDLVLTDVVMPSKDGLEVIAELLASNPTQPIIAMSGGRRILTADLEATPAWWKVLSVLCTRMLLSTIKESFPGTVKS